MCVTHQVVLYRFSNCGKYIPVSVDAGSLSVQLALWHVPLYFLLQPYTELLLVL